MSRRTRRDIRRLASGRLAKVQKLRSWRPGTLHRDSPFRRTSPCDAGQLSRRLLQTRIECCKLRPPGSVRGLAGEVAFARLHLVILVVGSDFDAAESAVFGGVRGRVADSVLAAHFILELAEGVLKRVFAIDMEHMTAGFFRHLPQSGIADAAEYQAVAHVKR